MKLKIFKILIILLLFICLSSCSVGKNDKIKIVTTIFPEYNWVENIIEENKENVELQLLLNSGADLHSYQPTFKDIMDISTCDLFIYVGGESDGWVEDALNDPKNKDRQVICLMDILGDKVLVEELVEGMEGFDEPEEYDYAEEYDEHVWLSLKNAMIFVKYIAQTLSEIDKQNKEKYLNSMNSYISELSNLDIRYQEELRNLTLDTIIVGDRFPFRYLVNDYGIEYYAAFAGCSAQSNASFETIIFLASKVDEINSKVIFKLDASDGSVAEAVRNNTQTKDQRILTLDSLQSATLTTNITYLSAMEANLENLKIALS